VVGTDRAADSPEALKQQLARYDPAFDGLNAERRAMRQ
jgi:hypothetical protein